MNSKLLEIADTIKPKIHDIVHSGEHHVAILFILDNNDQINIVGSSGLFDEIVDQTFKPMLIEILRHLGAQGYILVLESWSAMLSRDNPSLPKLSTGQMKVSDLPLDDRQEAIVLYMVDREGNRQIEIAYIKDTINERKLGDFTNLDINTDKKIEGHLIVSEW